MQIRPLPNLSPALDEPTNPVNDTPAPRAAGLQWTGRLAQGIAHDLANQLMVVGARARFALSALPSDSEARVHVEEAASAAAGAAALVRHLSRWDASAAWRPQLVDINGLIASLQPVLATLFRNRNDLRINTSGRQGVAYLDGLRLERTLLDLAFDHSDAGPSAGPFSIATMTRELDDRIAAGADDAVTVPHTLVTASCVGTGNPEAALDRLLQHWITLDGGPAIEWRTSGSACARLPHGAGFMLIDRSGDGCRMAVYVPPPMVAEAPHVPARIRERSGAARTVLVAENEDSIRRMITRSLHGRGYAILEAADGAAALTLADVHGAAIDVLVTDMEMPGMTGRELARALRDIHPHLLTLFVSGSALGSIAGFEPGEAAGYLAKPFDPVALVQMVATLLHSEPV